MVGMVGLGFVEQCFYAMYIPGALSVGGGQGICNVPGMGTVGSETDENSLLYSLHL